MVVSEQIPTAYVTQPPLEPSGESERACLEPASVLQGEVERDSNFQSIKSPFPNELSNRSALDFLINLVLSCSGNFQVFAWSTGQAGPVIMVSLRDLAQLGS